MIDTKIVAGAGAAALGTGIVLFMKRQAIADYLLFRKLKKQNEIAHAQDIANIQQQGIQYTQSAVVTAPAGSSVPAGTEMYKDSGTPSPIPISPPGAAIVPLQGLPVIPSGGTGGVSRAYQVIGPFPAYNQPMKDLMARLKAEGYHSGPIPYPADSTGKLKLVKIMGRKMAGATFTWSGGSGV